MKFAFPASRQGLNVVAAKRHDVVGVLLGQTGKEDFVLRCISSALVPCDVSFVDSPRNDDGHI